MFCKFKARRVTDTPLLIIWGDRADLNRHLECHKLSCCLYTTINRMEPISGFEPLWDYSASLQNWCNRPLCDIGLVGNDRIELT